MAEDDEKLVLELACKWRALEPDARSVVFTVLRGWEIGGGLEGEAAQVAAELLRALSAS